MNHRLLYNFNTVVACLLLVAAGASAQSSVPIQSISRFGGPSRNVAVSGGYAFIGMGNKLVVLDISDPSSPRHIWTSEPLSGIVLGVTVSGDYAYVTAPSLTIFDITDPTHPVPRGVFGGGSPDGSVAVIVPDQYICLADQEWGLIVVDVRDPDHPKRAAICDPGGGYGESVAVAGTCVFLRQSGVVSVIDVSSPINPQFIDWILLGNTPDMAASGDYLYILSVHEAEPSVMTIYDISNPHYFHKVGLCPVMGRPRGIEVSGNYAYIASGEDGLQIINVSNPTYPAAVSSCDIPGISERVAISGDEAFIAADYGGLQVVNIYDRAYPVLVGSYYGSSNARKIVLSGSIGYVADGPGGLLVIDFSDPSNPVRLGGCDTPGECLGVAVQGDYAYIADGPAGLQIIHITDPSNPVIVAEYDTDGEALSVTVSDNYVYIADGSAGLKIIDVHDNTAPVLVGTYDPSYYWVHDVAVSGQYACVTTDTLEVLDISDPANPVMVGKNSSHPGRYGVYLAADYAYVLDGYLFIFDVSNPASPAYLGSYTRTDTYAADVVVQNNYAYLVDLMYGLQIVDVSIPTSPVLASEHGLWKKCYGVAVSGNYVFKANGEYGIEVCKVGSAGQASVTAVTPNEAPDSGTVSVEIAGTGFQPGAAVKLIKAGQSDIPASNVTVISPNLITCTFNLTGRMGGAWNVAVTNPESLSGFLLNGLNVIDTTPPQITSIYVSPSLVPAGGQVWVAVEVTDNTKVESVTADGVPLTFMGSAWGKYIPAVSALGTHAVTVTAADTAGNTSIDTNHSYKSVLVVGTANRSLFDPVMQTAAENHLFKVWGQVTKIDNNNFTLNDGSGKPIIVNYNSHKLITGEYAEAVGQWTPASPTPTLNCAFYGVRKLN